ncbi:hypothetical protein MHH60_26420 [Paenibacillus sp. FSL H7-0716]|uniref:hypothetical protein n=1 Tax=Paenibacillus TaxID=44249 RepID=UPI00117EAFE6|nr:hypothetical protein [Paenibacillus odorifer]
MMNMIRSISKVSRSWKNSLPDFYEESFPPDPDAEEESESEGTEEGREQTLLDAWALCVTLGIPDSEWENMTFPKIYALKRIRKRNQEFQIALHGGEITKKPKKAKYLSDLGIFPK